MEGGASTENTQAVRQRGSRFLRKRGSMTRGPGAVPAADFREVNSVNFQFSSTSYLLHTETNILHHSTSPWNNSTKKLLSLQTRRLRLGER